jgi:predicted RNA binding protein YcfA (HicA-like mRNA interferase family)
MVAALKKDGFVVIRIKGSHCFLKHPDGRCTVVPIHAGETLGLGLTSRILKDVDWAVGDFLKFL